MTLGAERNADLLFIYYSVGKQEIDGALPNREWHETSCQDEANDDRVELVICAGSLKKKEIRAVDDCLLLVLQVIFFVFHVVSW